MREPMVGVWLMVKGLPLWALATICLLWCLTTNPNVREDFKDEEE